MDGPATNAMTAHPHSTFKWLYTATPWAFLIVIAYGATRAIFGLVDFTAFATLAVWAMTLFIQRAQHRDTQAIHAKLDELLRTQGEAKGRAGAQPTGVRRSSHQGTFLAPDVYLPTQQEDAMGFGKGALLWLLGIPLPIIILLALFWR